MKIVMCASEVVPFAKTGGLADVVAENTRVIEAVEPFLALEGLKIFWEAAVAAPSFR